MLFNADRQAIHSNLAYLSTLFEMPLVTFVPYVPTVHQR